MSSRSSTSPGPPTAGSAPGSARTAHGRSRRPRPTRPHPSVVVDDAWHARIFAGNSELSNATGAWLASTIGLGARDVRSSRAASGHTWLAFTDTAGSPSIASDETGAWQTATGYFGEDGQGAVTEDAEGRIHWVIAGDTLTYQTAPALDGPWTEKRLGTHAIDPSIAVDAGGAVHIVWRRTTSDEGTYYTTDASGSWVTTRLTRTSAEGAADLALDATGRVYVAVVRASWAANPGLYLVSNRTGDWVTTRVDGAFDALDPQLAVDATGRATVVLGRAGAGLRALDQTDFSPPTVDRRDVAGPRDRHRGRARRAGRRGRRRLGCRHLVEPADGATRPRGGRDALTSAGGRGRGGASGRPVAALGHAA